MGLKPEGVLWSRDDLGENLSAPRLWTEDGQPAHHGSHETLTAGAGGKEACGRDEESSEGFRTTSTTFQVSSHSFKINDFKNLRARTEVPCVIFSAHEATWATTHLQVLSQVPSQFSGILFSVGCVPARRCWLSENCTPRTLFQLTAVYVLKTVNHFCCQLLYPNLNHEKYAHSWTY